eukprot:gnl/TRDRNA2_/TRDRNA2_201628_c0_seq1.p1 gnl/TRDRNA2_/TRDRNA2_201628_c0~~gnl/TRDRNA2_/TRDRNA2_201628_c0_seq1.p1  ORF type:complete len:374 (+),score=13.31 gnl/TRDRNA2_/TRDRNA2_201628_c0_seq1:65-1186(+)
MWVWIWGCCSIPCVALLRQPLESILRLASLSNPMRPLHAFLDASWMAGFRGSKGVFLQLGTTPFSDLRAYEEVILSEDQLSVYFREGYAVVRQAFTAELIGALQEAIVANRGWSNNIWDFWYAFDDPALLDFYTYSSLGSMVSQILRSPHAETAGEESTVYLTWNFVHTRFPEQYLTPPHIDVEACESPMLPANRTRGVQPRIWIPLEDGISGPRILTQSNIINNGYVDEAKFWQGELDFFATILPMFDNLNKGNIGLTETGRFRKGDVLIHSPCIFHSSPPFHDGPRALVLFPTFATGSSIIGETHVSKARPNIASRSCLHNFTEKDAIGKAPQCFIPVHPPAARPNTVHLERRGSAFEWLWHMYINRHPVN